MKKATINFNEIEVKDLNGLVYEIDDMPTRLGNALFTRSQTIEVNDIARILHKGESVEVTIEQLKEIISIVHGYKYYTLFVTNEIIKYLGSKLIELNNLKQE